MILMWLAVLACGPKVAGGVGEDDLGEPGRPSVERPSGLVHDGVFTDETHGFTVPLLEGWVAEAGPASGLMRVAMEHIPTDTRVEFWLFEGSDLTPRAREGCEWTFQDVGRPHALSEAVVIAVCTPLDPSGRRVFGTLFGVVDRVMQVETHAPNDLMIEGKDAADRVIRMVRLAP